jgi:hypothetical protein
MLFTVSSTGGFLQKTILYSGFKTPYKIIPRNKKLQSILEWHFVEKKNKGRKPDKNSCLRRLKFMHKNLG